MKKCLLIVNPRAGQRRICGELVNVISELNKAGYKTNVFVTTEEANASTVSEVITDEDLVICAGGDGTLKQVVTSLVQSEKNVPVGYIPCGSTNDFASTLQLSKNIKKAIGMIINGKENKYDVGAFDSVTNDTVIFDNFIYVASFGLFSSVSYNTPQDLKNNMGHMAYVVNGLTELIDAKSYKAKVILDNDECIEDEFIIGMVANTLSVGGVMKLNPADVDLSDGLFEILLIKKPNTLIEFNEVLDGLLNKKYSGKMFYYKKARMASFWFEENIRWSLDGEESPETNFFKIENLQHKLTLIK